MTSTLKVLDGDAYEKVVFPEEWKGESYDFNDSLVADAVCFEVGNSFGEWMVGNMADGTPTTLDNAQRELLRLMDEIVTNWRNGHPSPGRNPWEKINFDTVKKLAKQNVNGLTEKKLEDFKKWYWDQKMMESETPHSHVLDIQNPRSITDFQHLEPMESLGVWLKDQGCTIC